MFQFRRFPAYAYLIQRTLTEYCSAGFPHSVIHGSKLMCSSPWLIAACHDLHRLLMPRHSPCALSSLTFVEQPFSCSLDLKNYAGFTEFSLKLYLPYLPELTVLIKVSTISLICFQQTLCCLLAFTRILHCSVFKVQVPTFYKVRLKHSTVAKCFNLILIGGDKRDRTADPLLARQVLSQLSYGPVSHFFSACAL